MREGENLYNELGREGGKEGELIHLVSEGEREKERE